VLDDARTGSERWDPVQTAENANIAVRDRTTIAYLGDGPSGATAISLPILNAAGIAQISPTSGYAGLTRAEGAQKGEPEKYYPSGIRSFARTIPADHLQVRALLALVEERGCRRLQLVDDGEIDGRGLSVGVEEGLTSASTEVVDRAVFRADQELDPAKEAAEIVARTPDCVLVAGGPGERLARLLDALHAADDDLTLLASDGLATPETAETLEPGTGRALTLTAPGQNRSAKGRRIAEAYEETFGRPARDASLYGYEAMELALAAIRTAGPRGNNREAVERALFELGEREGPFGRYRLTPQGDASAGSYSRLTVRDGRLVPAPATGERVGADG
nr:ABC transporter substrate-binding protein [Solirubrobacterales bacterium]